MPRLFAPRLLGAHLLALVLVAAAVALGVWQYDAWQTRRDLDARDVTQLDPVPLASVMGPDDPFPGDRVGQPVVVQGTWVPGGTVFVSGREHDGHQGYWVVTPLAVGGAGRPALPIVRGWVDAVTDAPAAPTGEAELVAWLQPTEDTGEPDPDPADDVFPQLRIADLVQRVDQDLYGGYGVVADDVVPGSWPTGDRALNDGTAGLQPAGLEQLPDAGRFTGVRNLLYAIEWWFFGAFAVFIWWRWLMDQEADARAEAAAGRATEAAADRSDVTP